jgi:hypothetical protein
LQLVVELAAGELYPDARDDDSMTREILDTFEREPRLRAAFENEIWTLARFQGTPASPPIPGLLRVLPDQP